MKPVVRDRAKKAYSRISRACDPVGAYLQDTIVGLRKELAAEKAKVSRVEALAETWRYKGEFGYDDGSHAYGPDQEGYILDGVSMDLRNALRDQS